MKVKCIDNSNSFNSLTIGKNYDVIKDDEDFYLIETDKQPLRTWFIKDRFLKLLIPYDEMVSQLKKDSHKLFDAITPFSLDVIHMGMGISGESGELLDSIKKMFAYGQELNLENVIEELGDIEYYLEGLRQILNLNRDDILQRNQEKLMKRYKDFRYSDDCAKSRLDKAGIV